MSFDVEAGDFVALMGPSGCGKSTLLHLCGAMDRLTAGTLRLNGRDLSTLGDDELTRVRREQVGFVFQFFNLLPTLTVADNIALPCLLAGMKDQEAERRAPGAGGARRHRASTDALPAADLRRRDAARRDRARADSPTVAARRG